MESERDEVSRATDAEKPRRNMRGLGWGGSGGCGGVSCSWYMDIAVARGRGTLTFSRGLAQGSLVTASMMVLWRGAADCADPLAHPPDVQYLVASIVCLTDLGKPSELSLAVRVARRGDAV